MLADRDHVLQFELAYAEFVKNDVGRHQLGTTGRLHASRRVVRRENFVGLVVDENIGARINLGRARYSPDPRRSGGGRGIGGGGGRGRRGRGVFCVRFGGPAGGGADCQRKTCKKKTQHLIPSPRKAG